MERAAETQKQTVDAQRALNVAFVLCILVASNIDVTVHALLVLLGAQLNMLSQTIW